MPRVIADTHALLWYLLDSPRLSPRARAELEQTAAVGATIGVSAASVVEIVYLQEKERVSAQSLPELASHLSRSRPVLEIVPVTYELALAVERVPRAEVPDFPDRIIAATALHLGIPLISRDRKIRLSAVETIW